jgi:hypothetical protein
MSTLTCSETVCPELCESWGEVTIANCFRSLPDVEDTGQCYCRCEDEDGRATCFAHGAEGADFHTRWIRTESECDGLRGSWETTCESACESVCIRGFPTLETRCEYFDGTAFRCECLCGSCEFTG